MGLERVINCLLLMAFNQVWTGVLVAGSSITSSSLSGQHLVLSGLPSAAFNVVRNATGKIVKAEGALIKMVNGLTQLYNFTYSILDANDTTFEPLGEMSGLINYLVEGKCDGLLMFAITEDRLKLVDTSHTYLYMPVSILIPLPESTVSVYAVFESFDKWVWIILITSIPIIISTLYCINRLVAFEDTIVVRSVKRGSITSSDRLMKNVTAYVIGLILHQARYCSTKKISARFVAATWCLASLFIFTFYNVSMFSYITSYQPNKLISSANELVHRPDVYLLAQKGYNIESILKSAKYGLLKDLGDKLRSYPKSSCSLVDCTQMVKSGHHVFTSTAYVSLYAAMREEYLATRQCSFDILKPNYMDLELRWGVRKQSPYVHDFNKGTMIMREAGLIYYWMKSTRPKVGRCLEKAKEKYTPSARIFEPLSLKNLNGAFVILGIGYAAAIFVFIGEKIMFYWVLKKEEMKHFKEQVKFFW